MGCTNNPTAMQQGGASSKCNRVQSSATECSQVQPNAIECNRVQSNAIECNHLEREEDGSDGDTHRDPIAERDHLWERDGAPWWALACAQPRLTGIQLPSAITCGERMAPW